MDDKNKSKVIEETKEWFKSYIIKNHKMNTLKCKSAKEFSINPMLAPYLSKFFTGNVDRKGLAKILLLPRVLGTSINTSFGTQMQRFISDVLVPAYGVNATGSILSGFDIEFIDKIDNRKKYAQLKAGPNTINKDDVETIDGHFKKLKNLARTNNVEIGLNDLIVGVFYGSRDMLSAHYRKIEVDKQYLVFIGNEFWERLTGDKNFLKELTHAISNAIEEVDGGSLLDEVIETLSSDQEIIYLEELFNKLT